MGDGRGLLAKVLSSWRWCPWGSRALLVGNMLLLFLLYIAHFQRELGHREALEAAVQDLQQELSSTTKSLQELACYFCLAPAGCQEPGDGHQREIYKASAGCAALRVPILDGLTRLTASRGEYPASAKQMEEIRQQEHKLRLAEEEKDKRLRSCSEDLESSLLALNISREQQAASAQAERCCTSVPMCNLCLMRR
eukprot:s1753_g2.t1